MNEELKVLLLATRRLEGAGIAYMVTGSMAMGFYATPRMTRDIDIVVDLREADIPRMIDMFKDDFYIDRDMILAAVRQEDMFNIICNDYVLKVDFILKKSDKYRQVEFSRRRRVRIDSAEVWMVSPEDLVLSKLWWAKDSRSERQLSDVKNLMRQVGEMDRKYLEEWVRGLGLSEMYGGLENG